MSTRWSWCAPNNICHAPRQPPHASLGLVQRLVDAAICRCRCRSPVPSSSAREMRPRFLVVILCGTLAFHAAPYHVYNLASCLLVSYSHQPLRFVRVCLPAPPQSLLGHAFRTVLQPSFNQIVVVKQLPRHCERIRARRLPLFRIVCRAHRLRAARRPFLRSAADHRRFHGSRQRFSQSLKIAVVRSRPARIVSKTASRSSGRQRTGSHSRLLLPFGNGFKILALVFANGVAEPIEIFNVCNRPRLDSSRHCVHVSAIQLVSSLIMKCTRRRIQSRIDLLADCCAFVAIAVVCAVAVG
ncbi:hypothetical protein IWX90DRAFT_130812 [Phyllosticta citrichinensis]|uniref:Uncharacterized protein n=1 Tax=Phyllosticta citrichinensis TaxID=1130410 RepID=A0ABR1Y4E8_9PEZI